MPCRREVSYFSFQLKVGAAASRRWNRDTDFGQDFARFKRRRKNGKEKIVDWYRPLSALPGGDDLRSQRQHSRRMIVCRIPMSQISADCRHVPNLWIRNGCGRIQDNRIPGTYQAGCLQISLTRQSADFKKATFLFAVLKIGESIDIDTVLRPRQPEPHHGNETLSAAQDLCTV